MTMSSEREHMWTQELPYMMSKSDSTPEHQETIQKSMDPSIITIAIGSTHTTEEATEDVCDLELCFQVQL